MKLKFTSVYAFYCSDKNEKIKLKKQFLGTFRKVMEEKIPDGIDCTISKLYYLKIDETDNSRIEVELEGEFEDDLIFVANILKEISGTAITSKKVKKGNIMKGYLKDVKKIGFGVFVNCGIMDPPKDVLLPMHDLRKQLQSLLPYLPNKRKRPNKYSIHQIIDLFGFQDNLPVEVEITKIEEVKRSEFKFNGKLSEDYMETIKNHLLENLEVIFTTGASRQKVKRTIAKRGHSIDILRIDRLGPLETAVICQEGTSAPGIISHIGKYLRGCQFSTLIPRNF